MKTKILPPRLHVKRGNGAFTIIEIMIVVGIIALLASIAIPYFVTYRTSAQAKACIANLRQIEGAKEQWGLETRKSNGDPCDITDLAGADKYIKNTNIGCPSTNAGYVVGALGERPQCPTALTTHILQ